MRKQKQTNKTVKAFVTENRVDPFVSIGSTMAATGNCWRWGTDNMFPYALAILARRSTAHREDFPEYKPLVKCPSIRGGMIL